MPDLATKFCFRPLLRFGLRTIYTSIKLAYFIMGYNRLLHARLLHDCDVTHISIIGRVATSISLREHANEPYADRFDV